MQLGDVDLLDLDRFVAQEYYDMFRVLRREDPVHWHEEPNGPGFWKIMSKLLCGANGQKDKIIGRVEVLGQIATDIGLDENTAINALTSPDYRKRLQDNWKEAASLGVIGVPSFVVKDQVFWGNDRVDFLEEYLEELCLKMTS